MGVDVSDVTGLGRKYRPLRNSFHNKGIGFAVCKSLAQHGGYHVILSARDAKRGAEAVEELSKLGLQNVEAERLDVADADSIKEFTKRVLDKHGHIDVLVNNAGINLEKGATFLESNPADVMKVFQTNTVGPMILVQNILPGMLKQNYGRIVNVSSGAGQLSDMNGKVPGYRFSKVALNALTRIVSDEFKSANVIVNSVCPGYVKTDLTGGAASKATRTPDEAAQTIVWAATLPDDGPRNGFFRDKQPIPW